MITKESIPLSTEENYRNLDLRPIGLDSSGRLTRNDIVWACSQAVTPANTEPIITPSQLDPAFSRLRGYDDYYTSCLVLRNDELPHPNHRIAKDCPIVMFLGKSGNPAYTDILKTSTLTRPVRKAMDALTPFMESPDMMVFDTILIDTRWKVGMVLPIALRKLQEAYPNDRMTTVVIPGRTMLPAVFKSFIGFGFHAYGTGDYKRFIQWAKPQPCMIMFSLRIREVSPR